ncbi:Sulfite oxidase, mitochondrial [Cercospora beticola]|uniref:Sulfite oxidase, mitochondrial n=1 Tax=Cercospora beticola TaxID=122368 RepID=A0A2G5HXJ8_CERBT|nr:Sulfite oxidase, mitochondrial [Cercospora beticola]PIA97258.1 Sulfite oxidase, mitochondrial [Cercospora beticola]WPA98142.1 hypothetical protein RHO25_002753 [Cercospora beticola]CAK1359357.1 unnamed protein product [Cercospora beticola]
MSELKSKQEERIQDAPHQAGKPADIASVNERSACLSMTPGFHLRPPPAPHDLTEFLTPEAQLFQTIHMGKPTIDLSRYRLKIHGLVKNPYVLTLSELKSLPSTSITSFHECYGSPLQPPVKNLWRIGNVKWTGVRLKDLLARAGVPPPAESDQNYYIWTDGLDSGSFGGYEADRYQKDLPLWKAWKDQVLVAWEMNGEPLGWERGGPVRLVVPGWFGTNSTKWLCGIELRQGRSGGLFTTRFYNERGTGEDGKEVVKPVWEVGVNSLIVRPRDGEIVDGQGREVEIWGWAWSAPGVERVEVSVDGGKSWSDADVVERVEHEWQKFSAKVVLDAGSYFVVARAISKDGDVQPLEGRRNHVHRINIQVTDQR